MRSHRPTPADASIKSITQRYGVAKGTAEKAFGVLREEGLVVTVPGRGIYVVDR